VEDFHKTIFLLALARKIDYFKITFIHNKKIILQDSQKNHEFTTIAGKDLF